MYIIYETKILRKLYNKWLTVSFSIKFDQKIQMQKIKIVFFHSFLGYYTIRKIFILQINLHVTLKLLFNKKMFNSRTRKMLIIIILVKFFATKYCE